MGAGQGATTTGGVTHALLWNGTPESAVDLNPNWGPGTTSKANGIFEDFQVGSAGNSALGSFSHATLWNGTAASAVDLNPIGFVGSEAIAIYGNYQVGNGNIAGGTGGTHALLWNGTAASAIDLNQYLVGLPVTFTLTLATGIDSDGSIVGFGRDSNFIRYPIIWTSVPEPCSLVLAVPFVWGAFALRRPRRQKSLANALFLDL